MARELLVGWGRTAATSADVHRPGRVADVGAVLDQSLERGVIARGMGRSYGDAAQNAGGAVLSTTELDGLDWVDKDTGRLRAAGGAVLGDVQRFLLPQGWALPVLPGTRHVTVGGAIAADVHGKNHQRDGSFVRHVVEMTLAVPSRRETGARAAPSERETGARRITPGGDPDLFWATAGGLGLTGVVLDATVQAVRVGTAVVRVLRRRFADLDDLMAAMQSADGRHRYAVAWLDALAGGGSTGRGIVSWGDDAATADLTVPRRTAPLVLDGGRAFSVPEWFSAGPPPAVAVAALNRLRFRRGAGSEAITVEPLDRFLFPLDGVDGWNRLYGLAGFVQYQFVVPDAAGEVVRGALERLHRAGCRPLLAVLKRLGDADPGPLSFPMPGWTLALDLPAATAGLADVLDALDDVVAGAGGRVYLAKDARLRPELVGAMYPGLRRWRAVRDDIDPEGVLTSDLGRRLGLVPRPGPGAT